MNIQEFHQQVMAKPKRYAVFGATKLNRGFLCETDYSSVWAGKSEYEIYVDTRYLAKMRLYKYLLKKYDVHCTTYGEMVGDKEIGVTKPILNF